MKVFISWSGERSKAVAEVLLEWLPNVVQTVKPWMSLDIEKGTRWTTDMAFQLAECRVGLICLTPENLSAPRLFFEAGALSQVLDKTFVCPYLLNLQPTDVQGPLSQFKVTTAEKEETRKLVHTINKALGELALQPTQVDAGFEGWWADLESQLHVISALQLSAPPKRRNRELLEEILETVRALSRTLPAESTAVDAALLDSLDIPEFNIPSEYQIGTAVRHPTFGWGVIEKLGVGYDRGKLTVLFRDVGRKVLLFCYAKLELAAPVAPREVDNSARRKWFRW